ncbi:hypothetical protein [Proteiniclasticum sp. QWL-01]|uniref:putative PDDEXK endonuclease n=1 Tax=Proteiniclasticum sp. QWL-01 TaxID=3036945 RepID=UPI00240FDD6D|nr:hypothetical protein [Proteiniclasticum sp. QWL-01]WFF72696.1 hypothetical protein P6M73_15710 [Proteiniclasticum sp. QWL-01]
MNSREKGARGERALAKKLREHGYMEARRGQQYSGANGDPDVVGLPGIHIECKYTERLQLYDAMAQAEHDAREDEIPVVIHKRNHCKWLAIMDLNNFIKLIKGEADVG